MIADMGLNEAPLMNTTTNAVWAKRAMIKMGNNPRGVATPTWWMPANAELKSAKPWEVIVPWFVIYPGVGGSRFGIVGTQPRIHYFSTT